MTTPHTPPAALDVAAIEARAAELREATDALVYVLSDECVLSTMGDNADADAESRLDDARTACAEDVPVLLRYLAALAAQHAADVAAAVAGERARAVAECRIVADRYGASMPDGAAAAGDCADAIAAPTGGGE